MRVMFNDDPRMLPLTAADVSRLSGQRSQAQEWFKRIVGKAAIEVAVVGDIDLKEATDLVAKYVGSLPQRAGKFDSLDPLRKLDRKPGPTNVTVRFSGITPKAYVLAGMFTCQELDPERRPLVVAAQILSDRMNERIREKEQLVYSIGASNQPGRSLPNTGIMMAAAPTDPKDAERLANEVIEMFKEFADKGPTEDELETAKKQIIQTAEATMKEPSFWMTQISDLRYRGRPLSDIKLLPDIYKTFTTEQVRDVVKKYATDAGTVKIMIIPEGAPSTAPAEKKESASGAEK